MKLHCPILKILLPVDGSEHFRRAVQFAGTLGVSLGKSLSGLALLHVAAKGYLSRHIEEKIRSFLDESEKILGDLGIEVKIEKLIVHGDPAREIVRIADERNFSTIIIARKGLSEIKGFLLGSVTNKVVHSAIGQTVYIVGHRVLKDKACLIPKILIPIDGSYYSMKGVESAACLAAELKAPVSRITLFRVINLEVYLKRVKEGIDPEEEARRILNEANEVFLQAGVPKDIVYTKITVGRKPADEILKEAEEGNYSLIIMGRKGRSTIKDLILGGVSSTVLHRCQDPTVAIVSSG